VHTLLRFGEHYYRNVVGRRCERIVAGEPRRIVVEPATKGAFDSLLLSILELQLDNQSMHPAFPVVLGPIRQSDPWQAASKVRDRD